MVWIFIEKDYHKHLTPAFYSALVMLIHEFHCNFHQQNFVQLDVTN